MSLLNQNALQNHEIRDFWLGYLPFIKGLPYTIDCMRAGQNSTLFDAALFYALFDFLHGSLSPRPPIFSSRNVGNQTAHHDSGGVSAYPAVLCFGACL